MGLFDGLYIFVQVKDRPSRDVGRDIRTIMVRLPPSLSNGTPLEGPADTAATWWVGDCQRRQSQNHTLHSLATFPQTSTILHPNLRRTTAQPAQRLSPVDVRPPPVLLHVSGRQEEPEGRAV